MAGLVGLVLAGLAACSSGSTALKDNITGTWVGVGQVDSVGMTVTQSGTGVTGTGAVNGTSTNITGTVNGSAVSLTFFLGSASSVYTGTFATRNQIVGSFAVQGGTESITFNRQ